MADVFDTSDTIDTLADLVRRPSVNPMGRDVSGPEYLEGRVSDYLVHRFSVAGIPWARQPVAPSRDNVFARLEATLPNAPVLVWDAHQDTVPADGMSIEPFAPLVRDGRLYGRGACDVKGGMAAMLVALEKLRVCQRPRLATVVFSATVNEEFGFSGVKALARLWTESASGLLPADGPARALLFGQSVATGLPPSFAIVAEPTDLDVVTMHKGAVRWRMRVHGRACHSAFPERGENAIYPAGRAILALEQLASELLARHPEHPCGPPTLSIGTIHGGTGVNLVADLVVLEIDRRVVPGESPEAARSEVIQRIAEAVGSARVEHDAPFLESPGLPDADLAPNDRDSGLSQRLIAAAAACGVLSKRLAARYGTNASVLASAGVRSVVFGPGSIAQAHTADEWIDLSQVYKAAEILVEMIAPS
jgi:acetylornithine deacetylase/succinyl-diaminopimelate desuccinylase-like protein